MNKELASEELSHLESYYFLSVQARVGCTVRVRQKGVIDLDIIYIFNRFSVFCLIPHSCFFLLPLNLFIVLDCTHFVTYAFQSLGLIYFSLLNLSICKSLRAWLVHTTARGNQKIKEK